jgi:O-antigen/teichoic acid export membrane protein
MTRYGAYISIGGAVLTVTLNILLIPVFGYKGSAYAVFICFFLMTIVSYFFGQKYYPIPYNLKRIGSYFLIAAVLYFISIYTESLKPLVMYFIHTILLAVFMFSVYKFEKSDLIRLFKINKKK